MDNDQLTNPNSSAQVTPPDNSSYSGATIPLVTAPTQQPLTSSVPQTPAGTPTATSTTPSATQPTEQPVAQPKTKQEWFQHLLKTVTPPQRVVRTAPDGTQTVSDERQASSESSSEL